jgi:hypothetical protein
VGDSAEVTWDNALALEDYWGTPNDSISTGDTSVVIFWTRNLFDGLITKYSIYYPTLKALAERYWYK